MTTQPENVPSQAQGETQTTSRVLMIRPACFGANPETAETNAFQGKASAPAQAVRSQARAEFDRLVVTLRAHGVDVIVIEDTPEPPKPDAVFPNNWISLHPGLAVLYPMQAPSRQKEVRPQVLERLVDEDSTPRRILDLRVDAAGYLEGTGSLVLDRASRVAYACLSPRTAAPLVERFCSELGYAPILFHATDQGGRAIYHTNVMMSVGRRLAVVCLEAIPDDAERSLVEQSLRRGGHDLLELGLSQMLEFAGNMLELCSEGGEPLWVVSARAYRSLRKDQIARLERFGKIVSSDLTTIETCGGGSARCMISEVF